MNIKTNNQDKCEQACTVLESVVDPEIGLNVVDLGLIYGIQFEEEGRIVCNMTLTTQFCPMGESISDGVKYALQTLFPEDEVCIELTFTPAWSRNMISEKGLAFLNQ